MRTPTRNAITTATKVSRLTTTSSPPPGRLGRASPNALPAVIRSRSSRRPGAWRGDPLSGLATVESIREGREAIVGSPSRPTRISTDSTSVAVGADAPGPHARLHSRSDFVDADAGHAPALDDLIAKNAHAMPTRRTCPKDQLGTILRRCRSDRQPIPAWRRSGCRSRCSR